MFQIFIFTEIQPNLISLTCISNSDIIVSLLPPLHVDLISRHHEHFKSIKPVHLFLFLSLSQTAVRLSTSDQVRKFVYDYLYM